MKQRFEQLLTQMSDRALTSEVPTSVDISLLFKFSFSNTHAEKNTCIKCEVELQTNNPCKFIKSKQTNSIIYCVLVE